MLSVSGDQDKMICGVYICFSIYQTKTKQHTQLTTLTTKPNNQTEHGNNERKYLKIQKATTLRLLQMIIISVFFIK